MCRVICMGHQVSSAFCLLEPPWACLRLTPVPHGYFLKYWSLNHCFKLLRTLIWKGNSVSLPQVKGWADSCSHLQGPENWTPALPLPEERTRLSCQLEGTVPP